MNERRKGSYEMILNGFPFLSYWYSGNNTGFSFGIKHIHGNVRLTFYFNGELLNFHISDSSKEPTKVWEREISPKGLLKSIKKAFNRCIHFYWWGSTYLQLSNKIQAILESDFTEQSKDTGIDLDPLIKKIISEENSFIEKRIRDGFHEGSRLGFRQEKEDWFIIIPISKYRILKINNDLSKSPLRKIPPIQAITRYFQYIEEERIFEQSSDFNEEYRKRIKSAIMGLLSTDIIEGEDS